MKATPRLPLHPPYSPHPSYLEMRYFRFSHESDFAAILFAFLEEASLPQNYALRESLEGLFESCSALSERVMSFALDWEIQEKWVLAAWNEDYYEKVAIAFVEMMNCGEMMQGCKYAAIEKLILMFHVEIVRYPSEFSGTPGNIPICIASDENGTALFYDNRAWSSFLTMPDCRCVHLKAEVFARARALMQVPMTAVQFQRTGGLKCSDICENNISAFVFEQGKQAACLISRADRSRIMNYILSGVENFGLYQREVYPNITGRCSQCGQLCEHNFCKSGCQVCLQCTAIASATRLQMRCLSCGKLVIRECIKVIIQAAEKMGIEGALRCERCHRRCPLERLAEDSVCLICTTCSLGTSSSMQEIRPGRCRDMEVSASTDLTADQMLCAKCAILKPKNNFYVAELLQHNRNCWVCYGCYDEMLLSHKVGDACFQCGKSYPTNDTVYLNEKRKKLFLQQKEASVRNAPPPCRICRMPYEVQKRSIQIETRHECCVCDECYLLYSREVNNFMCPVCCVPFHQEQISLLRRVEARMSESPAVNFQVKCAHCKTMKFTMKAWKKIEKLQHKCQVCDMCLFQLPDKHLRCPMCKQKYLDVDKDFLNAIHNRVKKPLQPYSSLYPQRILYYTQLVGYAIL